MLEVRYVDGLIHMKDDGGPTQITAALLNAIRAGESEFAAVEADVLVLSAANGQWRYRVGEHHLAADTYDLDLVDRAVPV